MHKDSYIASSHCKLMLMPNGVINTSVLDFYIDISTLLSSAIDTVVKIHLGIRYWYG
jgi:hypothetical protein